jgi:dihydroorotate dehydrogenase
MSWGRGVLLSVYRLVYERIARPLIFRSSAQDAHIRIVNMTRWMDRSSFLAAIFNLVYQASIDREDIMVGGVTLETPFILAAGFVKGDGFASEDEAASAIAAGKNIIPGWRTMPRLVGAVEFGSYTRYPRLGNSGVVMWRDEATRSTQNRVGLKNPGAKAAATFLGQHRQQLPTKFGINIAVSPGVSDGQQICDEMLESIDAFLEKRISPAWFTLNLSCPNTEDDPGGRQTEVLARDVCGTVVQHLENEGQSIPIWVKVSPDLSAEQYRILMRVFNVTGVRAVVATNTLGQASPDDPTLTAGIGGGRLHSAAVQAVSILAEERKQHNYPVDVIGCGGVMDGTSYRDYCVSGAQAVQYWSALIFRGPLAAAVIQQESKSESRIETTDRQGAG